jgi:hypothetical protein
MHNLGSYLQNNLICTHRIVRKGEPRKLGTFPGERKEINTVSDGEKAEFSQTLEFHREQDKQHDTQQERTQPTNSNTYAH